MITSGHAITSSHIDSKGSNGPNQLETETFHDIKLLLTPNMFDVATLSYLIYMCTSICIRSLCKLNIAGRVHTLTYLRHWHYLIMCQRRNISTI